MSSHFIIRAQPPPTPYLSATFASCTPIFLEAANAVSLESRIYDHVLSEPLVRLGSSPVSVRVLADFDALMTHFLVLLLAA